MVLESLDKLIGTCEARSESMVVEGVHLSLNAVMRLMQKHPSIVPFLVHISNEAKHRERFAVISLILLWASERHAHAPGVAKPRKFYVCRVLVHRHGKASLKHVLDRLGAALHEPVPAGELVRLLKWHMLKLAMPS